MSRAHPGPAGGPAFSRRGFSSAVRKRTTAGANVRLFRVARGLHRLPRPVGLASFTTEQRTKEIGIRKTMGGTVWDIVRLFTSEFTTLVLLANVIAWPIAYFVMQRWLTSFAYRADMSVLVYIAAAGAALLVAWLTVGGVGARAASVKPIHPLRCE